VFFQAILIQGIFTKIKQGENHMLNWSVTFFVLAIIAGILGFGGIAGALTGIAKICYFIFLVALVVAVVTGRKAPPLT
jgi:uncharacterized membrane protein YtjA (UPF0391 family)